MDNLFKTFTSTLQSGLQGALSNDNDDYDNEYYDIPKPEPVVDDSNKEELEKCKQKLLECRKELESNKLMIQSLQEEYTQLQNDSDTKILALQEENSVLKGKLQEEVDKSLSYQDHHSIETAQYEQLQKEFSQYKQDMELEETKLINELDETRDQLIKEQKKLTSSQANVAELLRQLNELRQAKGTYMYKCNNCPLIMEWVESLLTCLLSYLSKHPMNFMDPPSALPQDIYNWAEDQINTAQNISTSLQSFRTSMIEKVQFEQNVLNALKPLFLKLNIEENEEDITIDNLFHCIEMSKDVLDSFTSTYQTMFNSKTKNDDEEIQMKLKVYEDEKKALIQKITNNTEQFEKERDEMRIRIKHYEKQISDLTSKLAEFESIEDDKNLLHEKYMKEKRDYEKQLQLFKNKVEEKELLVEQQKEAIENIAAEKMSLQRRYDTIVENMKASSNDNSRFRSNSKSMNDISANYASSNILIEIEKQKIEKEANEKYSQLLSKYQELEINYKNVCNKYEQIRQDADGYFEQVTSLQKLLKEANANNKKSEYIDEITQLKKQNNELVINLDTLKYEHDNEVTKLKNEHQSKITELTEQQQAQSNKYETEIFDLRKLLISQQSSQKAYSDRVQCEYRLLRQLLVTYMTAVEGGPSLKVLMEKLNLSTDEQRVCLKAQIQKLQPKPKKEYKGFFSFLWGNLETSFSSSSDTNDVSYDENTSLSDLWIQFLMHETDT